ncbi:glycosyltransferase family 2 protein [Paenibacillus vini]|uniref:glycosyltransferase family 2 protein n=1 Tax=Paenibacillus vini TaxID=1476024 RepID=UPI0025B70556|nr:glycosyltransferase family 2 protein [Paenibacillus vini]MDN4066516.1 glycosyltransferase family 2 protein [Paenibacillus vini]
MKNKLYSVVVPLYNEEEVIKESYYRLTRVLQEIEGDYQLIFVNDGSKDQTEMLARSIAENDDKVVLLNFSRNFGHQNAITAGMDYADGDAVIVIDADLQDPPELIYQMIEKFNQGYDVVYAVRSKRNGESIFKKVTAKLFYRTLNKMVDIDIPLDTGDYRLISREACDILKRMRERNRFVRGMVSWIGFKQTGIEFERDERFAGETKYTLSKMIKFSLDGIISFSTKPLKFSIHIGLIMASLSFVYALYLIIAKGFSGRTVEGWTTIVVLILLIGGIQMVTLGVVGEYIARIYDESKNRPLYVIKDEIGSRAPNDVENINASNPIYEHSNK